MPANTLSLPIESLSDDHLRAIVARGRELRRRRRDDGPQNKRELQAWVQESMGIRITDKACCPGHVAPLDFLWDIYSGETGSALLVANRGGGKTFFVALHHYLRSKFWPGYWGLSFAATVEQSNRCYDHAVPWLYEYKKEDGEDKLTLKSEVDKSRRGGTSGGGKTRMKNSSRFEAVAGSERSVNGPHPNCAHCDEAEQVDEGTWAESRNMAVAGWTTDGRMIPAQDIVTSTRKSRRGRVQRLMNAIKEAVKNGLKPPHKLYIWCFVETTENQPNCRAAPENASRLAAGDPTLCDCDTVASEGKDREGGVRTFDNTCRGRLYHSGGWRPLDEVQNTFQQNSEPVWKAQQECTEPESEGNYVKWSEYHDEVVGFRPIPDQGPIYQATDWGGCYDEETEVLTARGWVPFPDVEDDDEFASMDPETRTVGFVRPDKVMKKEYPGGMERYDGKHVDLLVSADHRMLTAPVSDYGEGELTVTRSDRTPELRRVLKDSAGREDAVDAPFVLPGVVRGDGHHLPDVEIAAEDWAAFLGLWVAEGHTEDRGRVGITHYDRDNVERMKEILGRYFRVCDGIDWDERRGQLRVNDQRLHAHLAPLGRAPDKHLPEYVKRWTRDLLRIYLDWHARGDGPRNRIYTCSRRLADDLQEIAMYAGWAADVAVRPVKDGRIGDRVLRGNYPQYVVSLLKTRNRPWLSCRRDLGQRPIKSRLDGDPSRMVYCVHLPERHTLYVRRNGKAVWSGNTNPHAVIWVQRLDYAVAVRNGLGEEILMPQDSYVVFDEIYVSEIPTKKLAERVIQREAQWRRRLPGWHVRARFADPQGKADRLEYKDQGLKTEWPVGTRDFGFMLNKVQQTHAEGRLYADADACKMFVAEISDWRENPRTGEELDEFNHCMSALRYLVSNVDRMERRDAKRNRAKSVAPQTIARKARRSRRRRGPVGYDERPNPLREFERPS